MFPSRAGCASHGPAIGEREPPGHAPSGARPPRRRGEPPEHGRDKEKREAHTHRQPEQRRGKPQQSRAWTSADSRGIEPHPNNSSEPISSRTLHLAGLLSKKRETKQPASTRSAQQEPTHHPPNVGHQHPTGGTNHRATRPNVGHNTRTHALVFNRFASP